VKDLSPQKLSVFLLARSLEAGGAERQLAQLAIGLHERGHAVQVGLFYRRGPHLAAVEAAGVPVINLGKKDRWHLLRFALRVRKAVVAANADVLYSFLGGANLIAAAVRMLVPRLLLVWSVRGSNKDWTQYDWTHLASYRAERAMSRLPDLIVANSYAGRSFSIAAGFPAKRITVVPNGIDTDRFCPNAKLRQRQRKQWQLGRKDIAIGVLARLDPIKGHETFLRAACEVSGQLGEAKFFCIGEGNELARLKHLADDLGIADRMHFTGRTDDSVAALNGLDIYCSSSDGEGFSNSIAEAMACGLPCVVTDVGDSAIIVGEVGSVVPRGDWSAMAAAILERAGNIKSYSPDKPRRRIVENFGLDAMVDRTAGLLERSL
jgi:glycosyltransferase involved in cell wall biosynthesis